MENLAKGDARPGGFEPMVHGLRGIAALSVYLFHVYDMMRKQNVFDPTMLPVALKAAIVSLSCGVDLFFMISGYLITGSLIRHANIRKFLIDRVARLYPLFLTLHIVLFAVAPLMHYKWTVGLTPLQWAFHFTTNLFMLPGVFKLPLMQLNAWTLSYEWVFYIVSATVYFAYSRKLTWLKWALIPAVTALLFMYPRAVFFLAGAAVYFANSRKIELPRLASVPVVVVALPAIFAAMMGYSIEHGEHWLTYMAFMPGALLFALLTRATPIYGTVIGSRFVQFMGTISYSFYLLHPVVTLPFKILAAKILHDRLHLDPVTIVALFGSVSFVATVIVSYGSYLLLEKHGTRWLKAVLRGEGPVLAFSVKASRVKP